MNGEILTVDDLAKKYKVSRSAIYQLVEKGLLPHIRIGKSIRFESDVIRSALHKYYK